MSKTASRSFRLASTRGERNPEQEQQEEKQEKQKHSFEKRDARFSTSGYPIVVIFGMVQGIGMLTNRTNFHDNRSSIYLVIRRQRGHFLHCVLI